MNKFILAGMFVALEHTFKCTPEDVEILKNTKFMSVETSIYHFCAGYMEDDEMEMIFLDEGDDWFNILSKMTDEQILKTWPNIATLYNV